MRCNLILSWITSSYPETKIVDKLINKVIKPIFNSEIIDEVFNVLKDHFDKEHQGELKLLLESGCNPVTKLYFMNHGNKLSDCLKKLYEANYISNCNKRELEQWVFINFTFRNSKTKKPQDFKLKTLRDSISNKYSKAPCKNPLFNIKNGIILKV